MILIDELAGLIEDDEYTQKTRGYGAETIVAPEAIFGIKWDLKADIWSVGASVPSVFISELMLQFRSLSCSPIKLLWILHLEERNQF